MRIKFEIFIDEGATCNCAEGEARTVGSCGVKEFDGWMCRGLKWDNVICLAGGRNVKMLELCWIRNLIKRDFGHK